ncbi:MAG: sulfatase-like hydrolase/transferase [Planctomycetota bacterium]|nr:sulfatase-like hydrolase/transferase [Planctomycetota bacterium]
MSEPRPHLLLITTDQQRYDALGLNGNPVLETPNLDHWAATGVNFRRGYTTCPSCIAARRTILTGQAPATHGLVGYSESAPFDPPFTLPQLLRDAGYQTQLIGKLHQQPQRRRFGFEHMVRSDGPAYRPDSAWSRENDYIDWLREMGVREPSNLHGINGNGRLARPFHLEEYYHQTTFLTSKAIEFMTQKRDPSQPFFLHLSYWAPHPPLIPPRDYYERYVRRAERMRPHIGEWVPEFEDWIPGIAADSKFGPYRIEEIRNAMAGYFGLINHIDDQLQRLMEAFYAYGGPRGKEPLYLLYSSDHGEMLGDHHLFRKSLGYEGSAHVPFFIHGRNVPLKQGASDELVCLEDILPTFCELGGAKIPEKVDGKSLAPILRGEKIRTREDLHGEHAGADIGNHFLLHGPHKYIWFVKHNEEQIFDLEEDPHERHDLSGNRKLLKSLRERMAKYLKGRTDYTYDAAKLKPLENAPPTGFWKL